MLKDDLIARVFNNIMKNAVAYSYEGSTITIEARAHDIYNRVAGGIAKGPYKHLTIRSRAYEP